jgi:hypothetical protein
MLFSSRSGETMLCRTRKSSTPALGGDRRLQSKDFLVGVGRRLVGAAAVGLRHVLAIDLADADQQCGRQFRLGTDRGELDHLRALDCA